MSRIAIAGLQLEGADSDNLDRVIAEIDAVVRRFPWVDMIVASELNVCGTNPASAEPLPGPREQKLCEAARQHGIWLVPGSMFEKSGDAIYNTVPVIDPDGSVVARYRKLFPWLPYEKATSPGTELTVFDVPGIGRFGLSNCYDIWFPETIRGLVDQGAEVILHPSLTSTIDREVEHNIVRASAAMFQSYVFDVNLGPVVGVGQSIVAGPGGEVIHKAGRGREIFPLWLDLNYVRQVRAEGWHGLGQNLKSWRDRKLELPHYTANHSSDFLESLGPVAMPKRSAGKQGDSDGD